MAITDSERTEIFSRIGQLEGARVNEASHIKSNSGNSKRDTSNGGGAKAFASILVIVAIIGGMAAIVRPMQQQTNFLSDKVTELQVHISDGHPKRVDARLDSIKGTIDQHNESASVYIRNISKLEQEVAVLKQQMLSGTKDKYYARDVVKDKEITESKMEALKVEVHHLKELIFNGHTNTSYNQ